MKTIQRHLVLAAITLSGVVGCQSTAMNTASEPEPVDDVSQPLWETSCTVAPTIAKAFVSGTAPTICGTGFQSFTATSSMSTYPNFNADTCPTQFVVEVARSNNAAIGSGYYFEGAPYVGQILSPDGGQTQCERQQESFAAWAFVGGAWTLLGEIWVKGHWYDPPVPPGTPDPILFPCTYAQVSASGSLASIPANATKLRIAASSWLESGTKGADGSDTYRGVTVGIGAGQSCHI